MTLAYVPDLSRRHGSPYDRGSADAYYRRPVFPHRRVRTQPGTDQQSQIVALYDPAEIAAYFDGFNNETDRKDWW